MLDGRAIDHAEAVNWVQYSVVFKELLAEVEDARGQVIFHANRTYVRTVCNDCMNDATALPMCACLLMGTAVLWLLLDHKLHFTQYHTIT